MNKRIKVLVSAVLAVVMLVLCIPFTAAAAEETSVTYSFTTLTGKGTKLDGSATLVSTLNKCGPTGTSHITAATATNVYDGNGSSGKWANTAGFLKFGKSGGDGVLALTFDTNVIKVDIVCYAWNDNASDKIKVNNATEVAAPNSGTWGTKTFDFTGTKNVTITTNDRAFIQSITVYFEVAGACAHAFDSCTDTTCNLGCGYTRTALQHAYDGCEDTTCNNCTAGNRTAGTHKYTNDYDAACNNAGCGVTRTVTLPAANSALDIPTAIAIGLAQDSKTSNKYYVEGVITNIYNTTYGNMYIEDAEGNEICVYGSYDSTGANRYDAVAAADRWKVGDTVKVYGKLGQYNGTAQVDNGWVTIIPAGGNTGNEGGNTGNEGGNTGNEGGNTGNQGGNTTTNPDTNDSVVAYIAVAIVALFGIAYVSKKH